ncbi:MAG: YCF48-related protein [Pseudomonadota bacterium]|nr:YCF48-related protein [Pseudomonadota bacterium]
MSRILSPIEDYLILGGVFYGLKMDYSNKQTCQFRRILVLVLLSALFLVTIFSGLSFAAQPDHSERAAIMMPLASRTLVLDLATAGERIVAVGWRGHILLSDDDGINWRQVKVPTRDMLTGIYFVNDRCGWAVGHSAVILATEDSGETWKLQSSAPEEEQPLFDIIVTGDYGFTVGAYAKFMITQNGGKSWQPSDFIIRQENDAANKTLDDEEPLPFDYHLNSIARSAAGTCYIAAEAGFIFRSDDGGHTWLELPSPYEGSLFGILPLDGEKLITYGLRGHIFLSENGGQSWKEIETGTTALLTAAATLTNGTIIVTGMGGVILTSADNGKSFTLQQPNRISLTSVVKTNSDAIILAGERGAKLADLPSN